VSNLPPLPEIESFGSEIDGATAKFQWNRHVEVGQAITFGNGHAGLMYELGGHVYMFIPVKEADERTLASNSHLLATEASHYCPKCMTGFSCEQEPCAFAYESICSACYTPEELREMDPL